MKNKGASNIDFVLAFAIFVMFLVFMYSAVEPALKTQTSKQSLLDNLKFSFADKKIKSNNTILTITISGGRTKNCVKISGNSGDNGKFYDLAKNNNLLILNESGSVINYTDQGNGQILMGFVDPSYIGVLKGYNSTALDGSPPYNGGSGCDNVEVTLGSVTEESQIIQSGIFSILDQYNLDCGATLKTELGIPEGSDFTFSFRLANNSIVEPTCATIPNTDVYATTFPVQYLDSDANLQIGFLTVKVW
jgi:hypothetical protein